MTSPRMMAGTIRLSSGDMGRRNEEPNPRRPWLATVLSFLAIGLGHVYAGRPKRGAALLLLSTAAAVVSVYELASATSVAMLIYFAAVLVILPIAVAVDASRLARASSRRFIPRWYNRWYCYAAVIALVWLIIVPRLAAVARLVSGSIVHAFRLPSDSMAPDYKYGDLVFTTPLRDSLRRGDVVVYETWDGPDLNRIVALSGDTVAMHNATLLLNGRAVAEPYATRSDTDWVYAGFDWQRAYLVRSVDRRTYAPSLENWGPLVVPHGEYFILGDNRGDSSDSRYEGFVAREDIFGRPRLGYVSIDSSTQAAHWKRLGRVRGR